jgi:TonB family protein
VGRDIDRRVYLLEGEKVDRPPEIVGGYAEIDRIKTYPEAAAQDEAYGVIWLQCTISAGGVATRVQLAQGGHPALETEALNVIQQLDFRPATINGARVQSQVQIPVIFQGPYARPETEKSNG